MIHISASFIWIISIISLTWLQNSHFISKSSSQLNSEILDNSAFLSTDPSTIKIGLIITRNDELGSMAVRGAEMAVEEANQHNGFGGMTFQLIIRDCEGPWGLTSKEVTSFIYGDEVRAILASLDGRNAHLAEQVATKSHIALVSARASDPTLSQAFVPWYFRCVPNDKQKARVLYEDIFSTDNDLKIGIIKEDNYDNLAAAKEFEKFMAVNVHPPVRTLTVKQTADDFESALELFNDSGIDAIVTFTDEQYLEGLIKTIRQRGLKTRYYHDLTLGTSEFNQENVRFISPVGWYTEKAQIFKQKYHDRYNQKPGLAAAYTYDGMQIIIKAIRNAGLDRDAIKEELTTTNLSDGVTGYVGFDDHGNRQELPVIMEIQNGKPILIK